MGNIEQILSWKDQAIIHWTGKGIKLKKGISIDKLRDAEKSLDFVLPQDFVELYSEVNGFEDFDWNEHMFSLWSIERILKEYQEADNNNCVGFCDFLIHSHSFGFYKGDGRIYKYYNKPEVIADSFQDFILLLNRNDDCLY